ncbi:hypothetical protein [Pelagibius marinus]|uniref:hypothetical protein n=1 Tax=Pelagibius marinus TaxID=2762760 RepID=UPI0018733825|nr:hypothetical protein [Pelagibius marinus]
MKPLPLPAFRQPSCRIRGLAGAAGLVLAAILFCGESRADHFDLALHDVSHPIGEISARTDLGGVALALCHSEYLAYLNRNYREDGREENPLIRSTAIDGSETRHGSGRFSLAGSFFGGRQQGVVE